MPDSELEAELLDAERRLQAAQRAGDVAALDDLLDDHLIAVGPDGGRYAKQDDLATHRDRTSVIDELVEEQLELLVEGGTGVTFLVARVAGRFGGSPSRRGCGTPARGSTTTTAAGGSSRRTSARPDTAVARGGARRPRPGAVATTGAPDRHAGAGGRRQSR